MRLKPIIAMSKDLFNRKHGSLTLEAAIVVPIFILLVLSIGSIGRIAMTQEVIHYALCEAASVMADTGYVMEVSGLVSVQQTAYEEAGKREKAYDENITYIRNNLSHTVVDYGMVFQQPGSFDFELSGRSLVDYGQEWLDVIEQKQIYFTNYLANLIYMGSTALETMSYIVEDGSLLFGGYGQSAVMRDTNQFITETLAKTIMSSSLSNEALIQLGVVGGYEDIHFLKSEWMLSGDDVVLQVSYRVALPFFQAVLPDLEIKDQVKARVFVGNGNYKTFLKVDKEQKKDESGMVYITDHGGCYHTDEACFTIRIEPRGVPIMFHLDESDLCQDCSANLDVHLGMVIYKTDGDSKYHIDPTCHHIVRNPRAIHKEQAKLMGYRPCLHCSREEN